MQLYRKAEAFGHCALVQLKEKGYAPGDFPLHERNTYFKAFDEIVSQGDDYPFVERADPDFARWRERSFERAKEAAEIEYTQLCYDRALEKSGAEECSKRRSDVDTMVRSSAAGPSMTFALPMLSVIEGHQYAYNLASGKCVDLDDDPISDGA